MKYIFNMGILLSLICAGCATPHHSILAGSAIGGATGALIGNQHSRGKNGGAAKGALIGVALGGLIGYLSNKSKSKKKMTKKDEKKIEDLFPNLTRPKVRMYWVPDKITDNKFIERHRIWVIEKNSSWSK